MKKVILLMVISLITVFSSFSQIAIHNAEDAISIGILNSKELTEMQKIALLKMKNAKISIIPFIPRLEVGFNEYDKILLLSPDSRNKSISFSFSQLLFDNGKSYLEYTITKYLSYLNYLNVQEKVQQKTISIMETYYNLILYKQLIAIKEDQYKNIQNELSIIEYKYQSGLALKSDYLQYQISCKELKNEILKLNQTKDLYHTSLQNLLNIASKTDLIISDGITIPDYSKSFLSNRIEEYQNKSVECSIELKQMDAELQFQKKQYSLSRRNGLPEISLQGGVSFSGITYPLTQPDYSLKLCFSFNSLPFISPNYTNGYTLNSKRINSVTNSISAAFPTDLTYFNSRKIIKCSLEQSETALLNKTNELKTTISQYIYEHDNLIEYIALLKDSIDIQNQKLEINKYEFNNGLLNSTDYLKEQNNLAETKQKLAQSEIELIILQNKIQLLTAYKET